ncbi:MAG: site-specific integrase [Bacteroidales bacterium]|nr:site-specific integrase [Bacteroidales bacterium]
MATIKVKVRPSSVQGKVGTVFYQVTHRRIIRHISTDLHIHPEDWDEYSQRMLSTDTDAIFFRNRIERDVALLNAIVKKMEALERPYSTDDVVRQFRTPDKDVSVISFMKEQIDYLRRCHRYGTAQNYERAMRSFAEFLNGDIAIIAFNEQLVENYNAYLLQRGLVRNSISFYMRIIRAVYNKAVHRHIVEQTSPFRNVYTGIDKTKKRSVDEAIIARLCKLDLTPKKYLEMTRDIFIFSYCARGMAFVDIAFLKKKNIENNLLCYSRHKTGQLISVRMEPNMTKIVEKYADFVKDTIYIFPILISSETRDAYNQYRKAINMYNRQLKELSRMLSLPSAITSYTARHSWANAARKHNAPISVISAGLGHTSEQTTQIYLSSLENSVIDAVNKGIISKLYK